MKSLHILTLVSALLMVFGLFAPSAQADDKPAAAHAPFPFRFMSYSGDPKKDGPEKMDFQITTLDLKRPSEFLKLGNMISKTIWKLAKFAYKTRPNPKTNELDDVSELTLVDTETKQEVVLIIQQVIDFPAPSQKK